MTETLLIKNATILTAPSTPLIDKGFVKIVNGLVSDLGDMNIMPPSEDALIINGERKLVMPGLINSHTHCAMTLFRGLADDLELLTWLNEHIFPAEAAHVNDHMVYWCSKLAAAEMLLSGTTTVADGYFLSDAVARACSDAGLRAVVGHGVIDFPAPGVADPKRNIATVESFIDRWIDRDPLILPAVFAHSPYTCGPGTLTAAKRLADSHGLRFFIHLAESRHESSMLIDPKGTTPVKHLEALGLLDPATVCIHGIWFDGGDLDILAATGAHVVTCPQSNLKLASGIARVGEMLARGITVGLGTDGAASNNSLDMFREMDMLAKIHKLQALDATAMPASQALACATSAGAALLGVNTIGRLAVGNTADLIVVDLDTPHLTPCYNADLLVYSAKGSDVQDVIIDGKIVVRNRKIVSFNLEEAMTEVNRIATKLKQQRPLTHT